MHLLLLLLLLISPAFVSPKNDPPNLPILTFIPTKLTDEPFSNPGGGGSTPPTLPPQEINPSPPVETKPQTPARPPPEPEVVKPTPPKKPEAPPKPKPSKPAPEKVAKDALPVPKPSVKPAKEKPSRSRPVIQPSTAKSTESSRTARESAEAKKRAEAEARERAARAEYAAKIQDLAKLIDTKWSPGTEVTMPGFGSEAYANYSQVVKTKYHSAWSPPSDIANDSATVRLEIVIARDGNVLSAHITQRSGIPALDKSVERLLQIRFVAPFPEGAKEAQRTFVIDFNLKSKRSSG